MCKAHIYNIIHKTVSAISYSTYRTAFHQIRAETKSKSHKVNSMASNIRSAFLTATRSGGAWFVLALGSGGK